MKKVKIHILAALGAVLVFWACSGGDLEWVDNDDVLAMEKFDKLGEAEVLGIMKECLGKPECRAEMNSDLAHELENCDGDPSCEEEFINKHLRKPVDPDTTEEDPDTLSSSSSVIEIPSSSSLCDSCLISSSSLELSSSSGLDTLSSSSVPVSSSQVSSSSVVESSSAIESSSSFVFKSSSSIVKSSSSLLLLSSSEESSSSEEDPCTEEMLGAGSCKVTPVEISLGGEATWKYVPVAECGGFTGTWKLPEADKPRATGTTATYKFSDEDVLDGKDYVKVFPELTVTRGGLSVDIDCSGGSGQLKIKKASAPESSSSVKPESSSSQSSSSVKSSSSTVPITDECAPDPMTDDMMCQKPGRTNEQCVKNSQNKWVCPIEQSSSSVEPPPPSSSQESSSSVEPPPSSSSQESSSSVGPQPVCHAPEGCENPVTSGTFSFDGRCYFVTSINSINGSASYKVNGKSYSGYSQMCCNGYPDPIDGGYYIETTNGQDYQTSVTVGVPTCN